MERKDFIERILSKVENVEIEVQVRGFYEKQKWIWGTNPYAGEYVISGTIVSDIAGLKDQPITIKSHWSYNGEYTTQMFKTSVRPNYSEDERYKHTYEEGIITATVLVSLDKLPELKEELAKLLSEQVRIAIETRSLPGIKYSFLNMGYHCREYCDYPYRHDEVDINHYRADSAPTIIFARSFGQNLSKYKHTFIELPERVGEYRIYWWR